MDKARKLTDKELAKLEREISELYFVSQAEISEKWNKYMQSHKKKLDKLYDKLQEAKKSGDKDAIKNAEAEYERAVKNVTLNDKRYKAMINETTAKIANINQIALDYVNGDMPKIYTLNYNEFDNQDIDGYTFTLVNEKAVENLIKSNKIELPPKKVNIPKDQAWNAKNINSQLLQGIIQGESIAKIAKRLQNVTDMNKRSALRNARTMITGAENKGRQDSFKKAQDDGVIMEREWIAAHDDRTRAWHLDLHGVRVGVDEPWENDYGEIMFPGDPTADPANVYNCRCSIRAHIKGFKWNEDVKVEDEVKVKESKPSDSLIFADGISEEQLELISELYNEYDSRLESISKGAERSAGDVDITGTTIRLSSKDPTTALHEFAHTLANTDADKYGLTHDESFWKEIKRIRREYLNDVKYNTNRWISSYEHSHKKIDEFMAESFTLAKGKEMDIKLSSKYGQDLTYANKVLEIIDKYFRRKHK